jgi:hypothetical protein
MHKIDQPVPTYAPTFMTTSTRGGIFRFASLDLGAFVQQSKRGTFILIDESERILIQDTSLLGGEV